MPPHLDLDEDLLREMWSAGEKLPDIARRLGCSVAVVDARRRRLGLPSRRTMVTSARVGIDREAFARAFAEGLSDRKLAQRFGVSKSSAQKVRVELGLSRAPGKVEVGAEAVEKIVRAHDAGQAPATIGRSVGLSRDVVSRVLRERGLAPHRGKPGRGVSSIAASISEAERERRLDEVVRAGCARCGAEWDGTVAETHAAFVAHACARSQAA